LSSRCDVLRFALTEGNAEASPSAGALHEALAYVSFLRIVIRSNLEFGTCRILERVRSEVDKWANWNTVQSLVKQDEICVGVDRLHKEIDMCMEVYNVCSPNDFIAVLIVFRLCLLA